MPEHSQVINTEFVLTDDGEMTDIPVNIGHLKTESTAWDRMYMISFAGKLVGRDEVRTLNISET
jgi:hypothetical protein